MTSHLSPASASSRVPQSATASTKKVKTASKSLFSISNGQSFSSQLNDTIFVLCQIILTSQRATSSAAFTKQYVLRPTFKNDLFVVSFGLPALSATPRVLDAIPSVRSNASDWTYQGTRNAIAKKDMMNVASYNYLGFVDLEYKTRRLLEYAVQELPLGNDSSGCNCKLEQEMKSELKKFMGFEGCVLTSTGYAINLVAFSAMAASSGTAENETALKSTIFLMDAESHSSMLMGAFIACSEGNGKIIKFLHNDVVDLENKLQLIHRAQQSRTSEPILKNVWVTVEGMYSMNGTLTPLPEILALKRKYGFQIYIDEAHSFLAIGYTGRGVVEYFQDNDVSGAGSICVTDIDMIGGTLSKSLSSVGGFVLSHGALAEHIEARTSAMRNSGGNSIPTLSIIRTLQILKKPHLVSQRLATLRSVSAYVAAALKEKGYKILLTVGGPLIAIVFDTVDRLLTFMKAGRKLGLICCGAAYPAAPRGQPRVRLSLTGSHTLEDADELLQLIDKCSVIAGVKGLRILNSWTTCKISKESLLQSHSCTPLHEKDPAEISDAVDSSILALCPPALLTQNLQSLAIRAAGISALSRYNLGAAGPRWMCGTFSSHMQLEELLNSTIMSFVTSNASSRERMPLKSSLFTDSRIGIMSIIATAMEGLTPSRAKKGEEHIILLPKSAGIEIHEGAAAAQKSKTVRTLWYSEVDEKNSLTSALSRDTGPANKQHITLYLDTKLLLNSSDLNSIKSELDDLLASRLCTALLPLSSLFSSTKKSRRPLSATIIIKDHDVFTSSFSSTRAIIASLGSLFPALYSSPASTVRFLLFGSFHSLPNLSGLQGAFCTGSQHLVEKVQFLGQGVMYTAMMPPLNAALAEECIRYLVKGEKFEQ